MIYFYMCYADNIISYMCVCVCVHVCVYICMYVYMYAYKYTCRGVSNDAMNPSEPS